VGKTKISLELAEAVEGEIVSADSRQVYRGMDIGTAKPAPAEQQRVPHHLVDILDPNQTLTLAEYQRRAYAAIEDIDRRGRVPLLVGGSGQYARAVVEGWGIPEVPPDHALRAQLEALAAERGAATLHARLAELDPAAAGRIDYRNVRRVVRALEVMLRTGQPISEIQTKAPPPYRILQVGLTRPRPVLYARIDGRLDRMLEAGLVDEVRGLATAWASGADSVSGAACVSGAGSVWELPALSGLGYRQIGLYLQDQITLKEAIQLIRKETRRFVRQQSTWFRLDDPTIHWFDLEETSADRIIDFVSESLASRTQEPPTQEYEVSPRRQAHSSE
jgi:tRNA dimethylallyltransferase